MTTEATESNCPVTRAIQETAFYCGAASTVMVLSAFNAALKQDAAYAAIRTADVEPDAFYSDPSGISTCLDHPGVPDTLKINVSDFSASTEDKLLAQLYHNIVILQFPCPVLVNAGAHWVVVDGIRTTTPTTSVAVMGVYIVDPYSGEPSRKYVAVESLFQPPYIVKNDYGSRWKDRLVTISDVREPPKSLRVTRFTPRRQVIKSTGSPPIVAAVSGLVAQGFANVKPPLAGGGPNAVVTVYYLNGTRAHDLVLVDAIGNTALKNLVYAAVTSGGTLAEVATDSQTVTLLNDDQAMQKVRVRYPNSLIEILPGYFWEAVSILRSRFSTVRKARVDGTETFVMPDGELRSSLARPAKGGGRGCL